MPLKRLVDAVIFGFGSSAGARLFREAEAIAEEEPPAPPSTRDEKRERNAKERREAEIDAELKALKKRMRKK